MQTLGDLTCRSRRLRSACKTFLVECTVSLNPMPLLFSCGLGMIHSNVRGGYKAVVIQSTMGTQYLLST